jgi:hypothetical protein
MTTTLSAISARLHVYEIRPRKDKRGFGLISDVLPFDGLWYGEPNAVTNAQPATQCLVPQAGKAIFLAASQIAADQSASVLRLMTLQFILVPFACDHEQ